MTTERWLSLAAAGSAVIVAIALVGSGVPVSTSLAMVAVVAFQALGGVLLVRMTLAGRLDGLGLLGLGLAVGTTVSMLSGVLFGLVGWHAWGWAVPTTAVLIASLMRRGRVGASELVTTGRGALTALVIGALAGLASFVYAVRSYPLSWSGTVTGYHPDMLFFEAIGRSVARLGQLDSIFTPDVSLRYHWFVYAWDGQIAQAVNAEPFATVTRLPMLVAMLGAVLIAISWAARASKQWWVPSLAVILVLAGGNLGAVYGGVFNLDSPSQTVTAMWLMAYVYLLVLMLDEARAGSRSRGRVVGVQIVLAALLAGLVGGKISAAGIALAGAMFVAMVGVVRRESYRGRSLTAAGVGLVVVVVVFIAVLSGAASGGSLGLFDAVERASSQQGLNPIEGIHGVIAGTLVLVLAVVVRWAGVAYLAGMPSRRWEPQTVVAVGMAAAGVFALVAFTGLNALWFAAGASAPLAVVSAVGVGEAAGRIEHDARRPRLVLIGLLVASAVVYVVVWKLWATGASGGNVWVSTLRWTGPIVGVALAVVLGMLVIRLVGGRGIAAFLGGAVAVLVLATAPGRLLGVGTGQIGVQPGLRNDLFEIGMQEYRGVEYEAPYGISSGFVDAANWLRDNADEDDLVVTNRTMGAIVPAFTQQQTYASGVRYVAGYGTPSEVPMVFEREKASWAFINEPSAETVAPLCEAGVRWAFVDPTLTSVRDWMLFAEVAFENADAIVLQLDCT